MCGSYDPDQQRTVNTWRVSLQLRPNEVRYNLQALERNRTGDRVVWPMRSRPISFYGRPLALGMPGYGAGRRLLLTLNWKADAASVIADVFFWPETVIRRRKIGH